MFEISQRVRSVKDDAPGTVTQVEDNRVAVMFDDGKHEIFFAPDSELRPYAEAMMHLPPAPSSSLVTAQDLALSYARKAGWLQSHMEHALWHVEQIAKIDGGQLDTLLKYRLDNLKEVIEGALNRVKDM